MWVVEDRKAAGAAALHGRERAREVWCSAGVERVQKLGSKVGSCCCGGCVGLSFSARAKVANGRFAGVFDPAKAVGQWRECEHHTGSLSNCRQERDRRVMDTSSYSHRYQERASGMFSFITILSSWRGPLHAQPITAGQDEASQR